MSTPTSLSVELVGSENCDGERPSDGGKASLVAEPNGSDIKVTVKNVGGYCKTVAAYGARLVGDTVHITRAKPTAVSRCVCTHELVLLVRDIPAGASKVVYEEEPYASDAGVVAIASGTVH